MYMDASEIPPSNLKNFVTVGEAARITSLHPQTLRRFADEGSVRCYKTPGGVRKFDRQSLEKYCNPIPITLTETPKRPIEQQNFIYARVSDKTQLDELSRQTEYLRKFRPEYASYISIRDVATGTNFHRKGLETILDACIQGTLGEVVITHRDRLGRFGFELLRLFLEKSGGKITVLEDEHGKSSEHELATDLLTIINIYSGRRVGKRLNQVTNDSNLSNHGTEDSTE